MRLTVKLPAIVVGAILLTAVASGVVSVVISRNFLLQAVLDENVHRVEVYAKAVLFYVESARSGLAFTAELPLMRSLERPRELAALLMAQSDVFEYVTLLRPDGTVAMLEPRSLEEQLSHRDLSYSAWFAEVRRMNRTVVSDLHISPATQRPTIVIATPVRAVDGRTVGVLAGAFKLSELSETGSVSLSRSALGKAAGYVTDRRGLIIAHQSRPGYVEQQTDFSAVPSVSAALAGKEGSGELSNPIENEQKLTAYRPLPDLGWAVVYDISTAVALAPLDALTRGILSASVALAALIGAGVFVSTRRTVAPLTRLALAAQTIGTGDFSKRIEAPSRNEIGQLAEEFNRMAGALAEKDAEVRTHTARLQTANLDLTREMAERKRMQDELSKSESRYRTLFNAIDEGFCIIEVIFDENEKPVDYRFLVVNPSFEKQTGLIDAQGKRMRELAPAHEEHWFEIYGKIAVTGQSARFVNRAEQLHRWFDVYALRFGQPENRQVAILFNDITKQREANDALEASARALVRSNAELEQFAYVASHDLQEPLRMVVGYVQLLEKRLADKLDAETRDFMGYAVDGALRMQALVQDILAYSRVSTRGEPFAPVDSAAALKEALALLASRIAETGAEVNAEALPVVMADRTQLVQLFQNLVGNAIKFCKGHAPHIRVEAAHEAGRWRFSVTDNGIGIAPEYRGQLFVIFKRLHTRREYSGTGIGLAICKRIIERHGGEIGIESAPDGGSVFWFTLPEEKNT